MVEIVLGARTVSIPENMCITREQQIHLSRNILAV